MVYDSVTKTSQLMSAEEYHKLQQQYSQPTTAMSGGTGTIPRATITFPLPASSAATIPITGNTSVAGPQATGPEDIKKPPQVYYKGGVNYSKMPTPHLGDLIEHMKSDEAVRKHLKGLGLAKTRRKRRNSSSTS